MQKKAEAARLVYESKEKERRKLLQLCRDERERIIHQVAMRPSPTKVAGRKDDAALAKTMDPILYADLCNRDTCARKTSSCSTWEQDRTTVCSLGGLRPSQAIQMKLQRLTEDINKEMRVPISQTDRKIAALMLLKHQEELDRLGERQRKDEEREEARRLQEARQAEEEKRRRKELMQSVQCWHEELEARRRLRARREEERAGQLKREVKLQEERWKRLKEQVEAQRRGQMAAAQKDAQVRKYCQENVLRELEEVDAKNQRLEMQRAVEKEWKARSSKLRQEEREMRRLREENARELLHHILRKQQVEKQMEEEKARLKESLQRKMRRSCEKYARDTAARLTAQQERAAQEEQQIHKAQLRAKLHTIQHLTHKRKLVRMSQDRMQWATEHVATRQRKKVRQTHRHNCRRQQRHQRLRESVRREEEALRTVRENNVAMKQRRCLRLLEEREHIQQESRKQAFASFHLRERVRQETQSRTFAQMAQEAQLTASIGRLNL
ncbi:uncharacterized protein LOC144205723 isoform X2 [Stigmatopora nigra]